MKVCIISKFPPLEGGIAAKSYWLARAYADARLEVHVISNSNTAEEAYIIEGCYPHIKEIPGVFLHEVEETFPWHIPEEKHSIAKLIDKFLEVHSRHKIDLIDTGYLVPYGIAGYLCSRITDVPYVIRHGGSDIAKFLKLGHIPSLLRNTIEKANTVITDNGNRDFFLSMNKHAEVITPYLPNPDYFYSSNYRKPGPPRLTFIGKVNWYLERKGLDLIAEIHRHLPSDWELRIIGQGRGTEKLIEKFPDRNWNLESFVPPWQVPRILRETDFVFCLTVDEPLPSFSNTLVEALACGAKVVLLAPVPKQLGVNNENDNVLVMHDADPSSIADFLMMEDGKERPKIKVSHNDYHTYVTQNIHVLMQSIFFINL